MKGKNKFRHWKDAACSYDSLAIDQILNEICPQLEDQGDAPIEYVKEVGHGRGLTDAKLDKFKTSYNV